MGLSKPMRHHLVLELLLGLSPVALTACPPTDYNRACTLVKSGDGGAAQAITNGELPNTVTDFITFGSADCDNLICVRDAYYVGDGGPTDPAYGYCSNSCNPALKNPCPSYDSLHDTNPATRLSCRPLLLDAQTLAAICNNDAGSSQPELCNNSHGTAYFCARGQTPDAG